ncbi:DNA repair protein RadA [bacterium]|nr:DNA repair protein RadA [bacterium]
MTKAKTQFVCQECGAVYPKWQGQCNNCNAWNSIVEEVIEVKRAATRKVSPKLPGLLSSVSDEGVNRLETGYIELDRVLGGGIVQGSVILIGGAPGVGKSTLSLQISMNLSKNGYKILYLSGEESERQIKLRSGRLGQVEGELYLETETNIYQILHSAEELKPDFIIIDSIQTAQHPDIGAIPGSISQVRATAQELVDFAKKNGISIFLIGHITKSGVIAGPKVLEHMVDAVVYFEGDTDYQYRILRAIKNRYGSTNEIGIFEMTSGGLREVDNPSELFLSKGDDGVSGSVVVAAMEGTRPFLIEIQALVSPTVYGLPQRVATGLNVKRVALLCALLEKKVGIPLGKQDVFLNIVGGIKIEEPAIDLGIILAIVSSFRDIPMKSRLAVAGEVGLNGEIRAVTQLPVRVKEADRLGFDLFLLPEHNRKDLPGNTKLKLLFANNLFSAFKQSLFKNPK